MVQLFTYNGKYHLPLPTGKFAVGACDVMTTKTLMRLFYPCSSDPKSTFQKSSYWMKWFPSLEYADGYLRFKFSRRIPFSDRILTWLTHDPFCPIVQDEAIVNTESKLPVIVFSHGMGACRSTYSRLLTEMASQGYFVAAVEHRDGSAAATMVFENGQKNFMYERKLLPDEKEYPLRNGQVGTRINECFDALKLLGTMTSQKEDYEKLEWILKPDDKFLSSIANRLDLSKPIISGHSFGGVTAVKAIMKPCHPELKFDVGVVFDSWLYPIREEAESLAQDWKSNHPNPPNLLFVNCENFQGANNLKVMKQFDHPINDLIKTNAFTLRDTIHYAPTDIPTIFLGSWAKFIYERLFRSNPAELSVEAALTLCSRMFLTYLSEDESFQKCVDENDQFLIWGTDFKR